MGALLPWRPFRELERMRRHWESTFPSLFEDIDGGFEEVFKPAIDSYVKDGNLIVRADMPGLDPKDVEVTILGNVLAIKGERKSEHEVKKEDYLRREVSYGALERRLSLPEGTAADKVRATFKNGVVEVTVPMAREAVAKKVPIEAEGEKKVEVTKK